MPLPSIRKLPLRHLLTLPYVVLVLALAGCLAALAFKAGTQAVDRVSHRLQEEVIARIGQAVDRNLSGSSAVLEAAFPTGMPAPASIATELAALRTRFWIATSLHKELNNYAYYGNKEGQFFGILREPDDSENAELRLKLASTVARTFFKFKGINGELTAPNLEGTIYDPRVRPWYAVGQNSAVQSWTSIYIDFRTKELVATRAKRVPRYAGDTAGEAAGVVATDVSLRRLNEFVQNLTISQNGIAFIVEPNGDLVAASRKVSIVVNKSSEPSRQSAALSDDPLVAATYRQVRDLIAPGNLGAAPITTSFTTADGQKMLVAFARVRDDIGLDWVTIVAVPGSDFLVGVAANVRSIALYALLAALATIVLGLMVMRLVTREIRELTQATQRVGEGDLDITLDTSRKDELGELARSFAQMQVRLQTDKLTGLVNREALMRRLENGIADNKRDSNAKPLALLFIDLNEFKRVNDRYGHDVGDKLLIEVGVRLSQNIRGRDLVARYAGDEFVVLLPVVQDFDSADAVRERFEAALGQPFASMLAVGADWQVSGAVGLAIFPDDASNAEDLVKAADRDMYDRKFALRELSD